MPRVAKGIRKNKSHKGKTNVPDKFKVGFLRELDGRCDLSKVLRKTYEEIVADLGGPSEISHVKDAIIQRFVWLESILQTLEHEMATGQLDKNETLGRWIQGVNSLSGLAKILGTDRQSTSQPWLDAATEDKESIQDKIDDD